MPSVDTVVEPAAEHIALVAVGGVVGRRVDWRDTVVVVVTVNVPVVVIEAVIVVVVDRGIGSEAKIGQWVGKDRVMRAERTRGRPARTAMNRRRRPSRFLQR